MRGLSGGQLGAAAVGAGLVAFPLGFEVEGFLLGNILSNEVQDF